ncbi:tetratricopeptide repeat protein [Photorhabdus namnaonensis]|uniref:Photosystem I assembly protein Ycf3 n=1 Tax=Photorhabdus namnaonensis TaxID=1851568 RepID=A0A1B8YE62_9GAMM|nr:tetratricopeptide repeat protein [Photorhabdus namnaonensis]OCA53416.1 photosystem I assembly protein Ycf3 [Photorhabdus namnaonensis]
MMNYLDDLPKHNKASKSEIAAIEAVENAINQADLFELQSKDMHDYGTDAQLELKHNSSMTNIRIYTQVKGTEKKENADGSISISVNRTNINYLYRQRNSLYLCYHLNSKRLLVCSVDDVIREYERIGKNWHSQKQITINFHQLFDNDFQKKLHQLILSKNNNILSQHHRWNTVELQEVTQLLQQSVPSIDIPYNYTQASQLLTHFYNNERDDIISYYFDEFFAVLGKSPQIIQYAYMAEINLGINGVPMKEERIRAGIDIFNKLIDNGKYHKGDMLYCIGNAWAAINDTQAAKSSYLLALEHLNESQVKDTKAMCYKNLGAVYDQLGEIDNARDAYEKALKNYPCLKEAHLSLGIWHYKYNNDFVAALKYLDKVMGFSPVKQATVHGWKIAVFFELKDNINAFREINTLLGQTDHNEWILPWCAKNVSQFGGKDIESVKKSSEFWLYYLSKDSSHIGAEIEYLLCQSFIQFEKQNTDIDYTEFKNRMLSILKHESNEQQAFILDRIGHWAQDEELWEEAEQYFRKAYELEPQGHYGYCLGVVLNNLKRYAEALPLLLLQAQEYQPDAQSWYQVAEAYNGMGDIENTITSLQKTLELDPDFEIAWINLGGVFLNNGELIKAKQIFDIAIKKFPGNENIKILVQRYPFWN